MWLPEGFYALEDDEVDDLAELHDLGLPVGSHGHTRRSGSSLADWSRHAMIAAAQAPAAHRIENRAAGRPSRRNGNTIASTRNDSAGRSHAARARRPGLSIIP